MTTGPSGAAADGSRDKGEAEQVLLDKAITDSHAFTPDRVWMLDRNFPGVSRIQRMLETGTYVLIRVKDGITLRRIAERAHDGSYLATLTGSGSELTMRVIDPSSPVPGRPPGRCCAQTPPT